MGVGGSKQWNVGETPGTGICVSKTVYTQSSKHLWQIAQVFFGGLSEGYIVCLAEITNLQEFRAFATVSRPICLPTYRNFGHLQLFPDEFEHQCTWESSALLGLLELAKLCNWRFCVVCDDTSLVCIATVSVCEFIQVV